MKGIVYSDDRLIEKEARLMQAEIPSQYTNQLSTRRRICECIDDMGPMKLAELADELDIGITSIRVQARNAEKDGYLLVTLVKIKSGCGRAQHRYSRTSIDLPQVQEFADKDLT